MDQAHQNVLGLFSWINLVVIQLIQSLFKSLKIGSSILNKREFLIYLSLGLSLALVFKSELSFFVWRIMLLLALLFKEKFLIIISSRRYSETIMNWRMELVLLVLWWIFQGFLRSTQKFALKFINWILLDNLQFCELYICSPIICGRRDIFVHL